MGDDYLEWTEAIWNDGPDVQGTILQEMSLYDGVGCNDDKLYIKTHDENSDSSLYGFIRNATEPYL